MVSKGDGKAIDKIVARVDDKERGFHRRFSAVPKRGNFFGGDWKGEVLLFYLSMVSLVRLAKDWNLN